MAALPWLPSQKNILFVTIIIASRFIYVNGTKCGNLYLYIPRYTNLDYG